MLTPTIMNDIYKPTYTIRNIADVTAEQLSSEGIGGLVFARARGILTSTMNEKWFPYAKSLRSLGAQGIRFYLVADTSVPPDFFTSSGDQLDFKQVVHLSGAKHHLRDALEELPRTIVTPSRADPDDFECRSVADVGNWLSDIALANRAGFSTVLMPQLLGVKGLRAVATHPVEAAARFARQLPFKAASFPDTLEKDGCTVEVAYDETQESPS